MAFVKYRIFWNQFVNVVQGKIMRLLLTVRRQILNLTSRFQYLLLPNPDETWDPSVSTVEEIQRSCLFGKGALL